MLKVIVSKPFAMRYCGLAPYGWRVLGRASPHVAKSQHTPCLYKAVLFILPYSYRSVLFFSFFSQGLCMRPRGITHSYFDSYNRLTVLLNPLSQFPQPLTHFYFSLFYNRLADNFLRPWKDRLRERKVFLGGMDRCVVEFYPQYSIWKPWGTNRNLRFSERRCWRFKSSCVFALPRLANSFGSFAR